MASADVTVTVEQHVATVEIHRPPNNFFDLDLVRTLAETYEGLDADDECRAIVLCSEGKHFCAGADFSGRSETPEEARERARALYRTAVRLFQCTKPVVAAVQGAAVGGGLGLAVSSDFRITCPEARFCAIFAPLGFHQGFGLSYTLPRLIGNNQAELMLLTGRRVKGAEAVRIGLANELVELEEVRSRAHALAGEIAACAPLAVLSIRKTLRREFAEEVAAATEYELDEQIRLKHTADFREGVSAMGQRRTPVFHGR